MSLSVASHVNLDTIKNLDASKTYFLSSTTGQVKEASLMMRFKCWLGVSSTRQKVANLVDAVRTTLLESASSTQNAALDSDIRNVGLKEMVKGSVIKDIANRFTSANAEKIVKAKAEVVLNDLAKTIANNVLAAYPGRANAEDLARIARHALKPMLAGDLPTKKTEDGIDVLHESKFRLGLEGNKFSLESTLVDILKSKQLDGGKLDSHYADHVIDTLYKKDGTWRGKTIADLKTPLQVKVDFAFKLNEKAGLGSFAPTAYSHLEEAKVNPEEKIAKILDFCGDDDELKEYVLDIAPHLCVSSNYDIRTDDEIQKKISDIKAGLSEINNVQMRFPGSAPALKFAMKTLGASSFAKGLLKDVAATVNNHGFNIMKNLNSLSKAEDIYAGIDELRQLVGNVGKRLGEKIVGGPEGVFVKNAVVALAMSKLGPGFAARLPGILRGTEFGIMNKTMDTFRKEMNGLANANLIDDESKAKNVLEDMNTTSTMLLDYCREVAGLKIDVAEVPQIDPEADSSKYMLYTLSVSET